MVTVGKTLGLGLTMLTNIIIVRQLGPEEYGIFAIGFAIIFVLNGVIGEAMDFGVLKAFPLYRESNDDKARLSINITFKIKMLLCLLLFLTAVVLDDHLTLLFLNSSENIWIISVSALGFWSMTMLKSVSTYFQANEKFRSYLLAELSNTVLKFIGVLTLLYLGTMTALSALSVFTLIPLIVFLMVVKMVPPRFFWTKEVDRETLSYILNFNKWVILSFALSAIYGRLDVFILGLMRDAGDVGLYSAAFNLGMLPEIAVSFVVIVLYPKIISYYRKGVLKEYFKKSIALTLPVCILAVILSYLLARPVIELFYTETYAESVPIFQIIIIGYIMGWLVLPLAAPLIMMVRPRLFVLIELVNLMLISTGYYLAVPLYGPIGAAYVSMLTRIVSGAAMIWFAYKIIDESEARQAISAVVEGADSITV